jgi:hypothetical protein
MTLPSACLRVSPIHEATGRSSRVLGAWRSDRSEAAAAAPPLIEQRTQSAALNRHAAIRSRGVPHEDPEAFQGDAADFAIDAISDSAVISARADVRRIQN